MAFDPDKFKFQKRLEGVHLRYGENATLMLREVEYQKKSRAVKEPKHSFAHLLEVTFPVPELNVPAYVEVNVKKPVNTFHISEQDRVNRLLRNGAKEKTQFDD